MKFRALRIVILAVTVALGGRPHTADASDAAKPSVTVFPVVAAPRKFSDDFAKRVGTVIATFLEKAGLVDLEIADAMFNPPETDEINKIAEAFGKHVVEKPINTDYAVFAQFLGTPKTGVNAIRTIVVDKAGKVLLADSAGDAEFDKAPLRPKDPMTCCVFVGQQLRDFWKLDDPLRANAPTGKMARFWQKDAGIPAKDELNAISNRSATLKKNIQTATLTVYPVNVGRQSDKQCAHDLIDLLNQDGLGKAEASQQDPALKIAGHTNEQKVLWDTARAFRDFVRENRPTTDYAMYADYGLAGSKVHHAHAIICDRSGDWVMIDMQNSHHPEFQRIDPKSSADCNRLLIARLKVWLNQ